MGTRSTDESGTLPTVLGRTAQSSFPSPLTELREQSSQRFREGLRRLVFCLESAGEGCLNFAIMGLPFPSRAKSSNRESSSRVCAGCHGACPLIATPPIVMERLFWFSFPKPELKFWMEPTTPTLVHVYWHGDGCKVAGTVSKAIYILRKLVNWSQEQGQDPAYPDTSALMEPIAHGLSEPQIRAVAAYLSNLE